MIRLLYLVLLAAAAAAGDGPVLTALGSVRWGDRELAVVAGHLRVLVAGREVAMLLPCWTAADGGWGEPRSADAGTTAIDPAAGTARWTGTRAGATWSVALALGDGGAVRCRLAVAGDGLRMRAALLVLPAGEITGASVADGERRIAFPAAPDTLRHELRERRLELYAGDPRRWAITTPTGPPPSLHDARAGAHPQVEGRFALGADGSTELLIDLRPADGTVTWAEDPFDPLGWQQHNRARLPWFAGCRNLVQNPGFEDGLRGWEFKGTVRDIAVADSREAFVLDDQVAYEGRRSLRIELHRPTAERPLPSLPLVLPYNLQLIPGRPYTVSAWARADQGGLSLTTRLITKDLGKHLLDRTTRLGREWQRVVATVTPAPGQALTALYLGVGNPGSFAAVGDRPAHVWIDAVQVEAGGEATPFAAKGVGVRLEGPATQELRRPRRAGIVIANRDAATHRWTVRATVQDLLARRLLQRERSVELAPGAEAVVDLEPGDALDRIGLYGIAVEVADGEALAERAFLRLAVIDPFSPDELRALRNRRAFGLGTVLPPAGDQERTIRRLRELGVGFVEPGHFFPVAADLAEVIAGNGLDTLAAFVGDAGRNPALDVTRVWHETDHAGPLLSAVYAGTTALVATHPWHRAWKYLNEPPMHVADPAAVCNPVGAVEFMRRTRPLVLAGRPDALLVSPEPATAFESGRQWLERMLDAGGGPLCDVLAIHNYRNRPEAPDLERDSAALIALADRHDFRGELWYTEGGAYPLYRLPAIGVSPSRTLSGDEVRVVSFSDDIQGDCTGAALHARHLLAVLRYAERIPVNVNWLWHLTGFYEPLQDVPKDIGMVYHALARSLGQARFVRSVDMHEALRCHVFDDGRGGGVAAVWDHDERLESGARAPYRLRLPAGVAASDLFGRPLDPTPEGVALGAMPLLLRGATAEALAGALAGADLDFGREGLLAVDLAVREGGRIVAAVRNRGTAPVAATVRGTLGGTPVEGATEVPRRGGADLPLTILPADALDRRLDADLTVAGSGPALPVSARLRTLRIPQRRTPIAIDGDLGDWAGLPEAVLDRPGDMIAYRPGGWSGPEDHGARLRLAWDGDGLWLAMAVRDDIHHQPYAISQAWKGDSLQLFIDAFKDGTALVPNGDDDSVHLVALAEGRAQVWRSVAPARQYAFLPANVVDPEIRAAVVRDEAAHATTYELLMPASRLAPLRLRAGAVFGLGLLVNDADGGDARDSALSSADGNELWQRPQHLAWAVLAE